MGYFNAMKENEINFYGGGLNIRNNCQQGLWTLVTNPLHGEPIDIAILEVDFLEGNFDETRPNTLWKQIWFIPSPSEKTLVQNVVYQTLVKGESLQNFEQCIILAQTQYNTEYDFIVTAFFDKRTNKNAQAYYVINFTSKPRTEEEAKQIPIIKKFQKTNPVFDNQELKARMKEMCDHSLFMNAQVLDGQKQIEGN